MSTLPFRPFTILPLVCAAPLAAQVPGGGGPQPAPCLPFQPDNTVEWPETGFGSASEFRRIVVAELDGDQSPEGVVNVGGVPVVLWDLVAYDAPQVIHFPSATQPTAVADIAVLPGGGSNGNDALLMTDSRGLFLVDYDGGAFVDPAIIAPSWINATPIHVDNVDLQGALDVYGIAADKKTILALLSSGNGSTLTVTQPYVLTDIVAMNWNHSGPRELVALSANRGLRVYTSAGASLLNVSYPYPGCIARIDGPIEYLAWSRGTSSGASELMIYGDILPSNRGLLTFDLCEWTTNITPTALVTGDYDGDGDDDLLIAHEANQTAVVLVNQDAYPFYVINDPAKFDVIPLGALAQNPGDVGIPAFAQLDPEGSPLDPEPGNPEDLAFPVSATAKVEVFTTLCKYRQDNAVGSQPPPSAADVFHDFTEFNPGTGNPNEPPEFSRLVLAFNFLNRYANCDKVDLVVWGQQDPSHYVPPTPGAHTRYTLDLTDAGQQWILSPYAFPLGSCWGESSSEAPCFYVELRFRELATGYASRIFTAGFRLDSCSSNPAANDAYVVQQGIPGESFGLYVDHGIGPVGPSYGNGLIGIFVPMSSSPPFNDGLPPVRGTPTVWELYPNAVGF